MKYLTLARSVAAALTVTFFSACGALVPAAAYEGSTVYHYGWLQYCGTEGYGSDECKVRDITYEDVGNVSYVINATITYADDEVTRGTKDHWGAFPKDLLGDCDDYAISKYRTLRGMGVPKEDIRLYFSVVYDNTGATVGGHLVVGVDIDNVEYILDSYYASFQPASEVSHIYEKGKGNYPTEYILKQTEEGRWVYLPPA